MVPVDLAAEYKEIKSGIQTRLARVLKSGRFILDREVMSLESSFARLIGTQFAVAVASGSDALLLSLMALGIGKGDEVITTPLSFIATPAAIVRVGARPVFVDIDPRTFQIDPAKIEGAITQKTKAILPVHLYGSPADMTVIGKLAQKHGLTVIEDCAQSTGAKWKGRMTGSFGQLGAFSFYPTKTLGAFGDGGMITTDQAKLNTLLRSLRNQGTGNTPYHHEKIGLNSRLDELQAAILNVKIKRLSHWNSKRRAVAKQYNHLLEQSGVNGSIEVPARYCKTDHVFHQYPILTDRRDALLRYLRKHHVPANVYYPTPLHLQPCLKHLGYHEGDLPEVEKVCERILHLPIHPYLSVSQQQFIVGLVKKFF
ncbi:MAG: transcriptional regulator [Candidatus Omnitrophica bacterium CG11_big_fil_rev_8_21_14_0_20_45_26]|uniref:Transcriptional regulator n=1 Tax=Candidatus Abzuiibacterium crystallinum TaxID=1974748 RepID=A0A2H0LRQ2_9BACT|nr:MAG: transcriptional regulator [Candidatus Omnitrophica bacterium CG11_big_fil_rev_8_21_14_0_20_45_26]PIW65741.1 MAG: transcriptional regulator [Candidatus Omnitrophica bacterium CG12_big_fil_rev_8_21_14_0_65_45_16]